MLLRFDAVERAVHWVNAALFGVLVVTGAALYVEPLEALIGRRAVIEDVHVYCGIALPVPLVLAVWGRWGRMLRQDLRRFNRWSAYDRRWLRTLIRPGRHSMQRASELPVGKFNAGQKLNASFVAGTGLVMLGTGVVMRWYHPYPVSWRTGATFVHDWLAVGLGLAIVGHIGMALRDADALKSMITGKIALRWAEHHAALWIAGEDGPSPSPPTPLTPEPVEQAGSPSGKHRRRRLAG